MVMLHACQTFSAPAQTHTGAVSSVMPPPTCRPFGQACTVHELRIRLVCACYYFDSLTSCIFVVRPKFDDMTTSQLILRLVSSLATLTAVANTAPVHCFMMSKLTFLYISAKWPGPCSATKFILEGATNNLFHLSLMEINAWLEPGHFACSVARRSSTSVTFETV